jgi:hypothetical protein
MQTENWLSAIIEENRRAIDPAFPRRDRKAKCASIMAAIQASPHGAALIAKPELAPAISAALDVADAVDRAIERDPHLVTESPAAQASCLIFDRLRLPRPEA